MRMVLVGLCLALVGCATTSATDTVAANDPAATRAWLAEFEAQYAYDTGYMEQLLELSPGAYDAFAGAMGMAEVHEQLPVDAHFVGCISALLADDCGACTQLNLKMAVEAGVDRALLRQLMEDPAGLSPLLRQVHDYATQVVRGGNADAELVRGLRAQIGDEAFGELAVNVLGCRIYPGLRRAMGAETVCPAPTLDF